MGQHRGQRPEKSLAASPESTTDSDTTKRGTTTVRMRHPRRTPTNSERQRQNSDRSDTGDRTCVHDVDTGSKTREKAELKQTSEGIPNKCRDWQGGTDRRTREEEREGGAGGEGEKKEENMSEVFSTSSSRPRLGRRLRRRLGGRRTLHGPRRSPRYRPLNSTPYQP